VYSGFVIYVMYYLELLGVCVFVPFMVVMRGVVTVVCSCRHSIYCVTGEVTSVQCSMDVMGWGICLQSGAVLVIDTVDRRLQVTSSFGLVTCRQEVTACTHQATNPG